MATIDELIAGHEVELEAATKRRDKTIAEAKSILALATQEGRSNLTEEEGQRVEQLKEAREQAKKDIEGIRGKLAQAQSIKAEETEAQRAAKEVTKTETRRPSYDQVARVGSEERTYHKGNDRRGSQFVKDVTRQFLYGDIEASTRLQRHMAEEKVERAQYLTRAAGTGAFSGLVVPQYLTDMYAPAVAALRPFADACNKHDLPADGMTVNISRVTTASSVDLQATENTAVAEQNVDDTLLTENVQTASGQQTLSRQAIERGTGVEEVVMDDLFRRYATSLDSTLINQATTGLSPVSTATSYTDTSPTGAELYPKILEATSGAEAALLAQATPDLVVMHSRRWYWLSSQMTNTWPLISSFGAQSQVGGLNSNAGYDKGARGVLPNGLSVVVDNNVPTTVNTSEDEIYVVASSECHLWEDPNAPVFLRAEQAAAASLGVLLVLYGYFAYSFRRYPGGMRKVSGSGLTTPAF